MSNYPVDECSECGGLFDIHFMCSVDFPARCAAVVEFDAAGMDALDELVRDFYMFEGNAAGGSLHIVLDDGNIRDSDVDFCIDYAQKNNAGPAAIALAQLLRRMTYVERVRWSMHARDKTIYMLGYCDECGGNDCADPSCQIVRMCDPNGRRHACDDSVGVHHHEDGSWWFAEVEDPYDLPPVQAPERGPYVNEDEAVLMANHYLRELLDR